MKTTVKARGRQGTSSLDLTIPVDFCKELDIKPGDIFKLEYETTNDNEIVLNYKLVFKDR